MNTERKYDAIVLFTTSPRRGVWAASIKLNDGSSAEATVMGRLSTTSAYWLMRSGMYTVLKTLHGRMKVQKEFRERKIRVLVKSSWDSMLTSIAEHDQKFFDPHVWKKFEFTTELVERELAMPLLDMVRGTLVSKKNPTSPRKSTTPHMGPHHLSTQGLRRGGRKHNRKR